MVHTLQAEQREKTSNSKIRASGRIPAVMYGPKEPSTPISIQAAEFTKLFKVAGESSVIEIEGVGETKEALVHDIDADPVTGTVRHVDFYVIEKGKSIEVDVPFEFIGESPAVKELGGVLVKVLHELKIEVLPKNLPHSISVDISSLVNFESQIHVRDLVVPAGVTVLTGGDEVVALTAEAKEEPVEPVAAPDLSSIEVEKKGKEANPDEEAPVEGKE
jgi:large subunit ribosomal protein L25